MTLEHFDVLIVGAGISGIGAGYHLQARSPRNRTYAILEGRDDWAAPGISSAIRASAPTATCTRWATASSRGRPAKAIADGPSILEYLRETAPSTASTATSASATS